MSPNWLTFVRSYLSGRTMRVKVGNSLSTCCPVDSGVPQGSVLGPSLFLACINEIADLNLKEHSRIILFADDLALVHPLCSEDSVCQAQDDLNNLSSCIKDLGLKLNVGKCRYISVHHLSNAATSTSLTPPVFSIDGTPLEKVEEYKYLGISIDDKLNFAKHTTTVVIRAKQIIGALSRALRKWSTAKVLKSAFTSIALPVLFYAIESWYPPNITQQYQIERVQKFAARLISNNFSQASSYEQLLDAANLRPIYRQVAERRRLFGTV